MRNLKLLITQAKSLTAKSIFGFFKLYFSFISNILLWFNKNFIKIFIIFCIGFIFRFVVNFYFGINVFVDFTNIISIVFYGIMSSLGVFINEWNLDFNSFKLNINRDSIIFKKIVNLIRSLIKFNIEKQKIPINGENFTFLEDSKKGNALFMDNQQATQSGAANPTDQGIQQGAANPTGQQQGAVDPTGQQQGAVNPNDPQVFLQILPDGTYNTPPMLYERDSTNQPYGRILSLVMRDLAIRSGHFDARTESGTVTWDPSAFNDDARNFFLDFMEHRHPNRIGNQYWNSGAIRKELKRLP